MELNREHWAALGWTVRAAARAALACRVGYAWKFLPAFNPGGAGAGALATCEVYGRDYGLCACYSREIGLRLLEIAKRRRAVFNTWAHWTGGLSLRPGDTVWLDVQQRDLPAYRSMQAANADQGARIPMPEKEA